MFGRASRGVAETLAPRSRAAPLVPSVVSEGLHIAGSLFAEGDVQIDGRIEGDVHGRTITVGVTGAVVGKIVADEAVISGTVSGGIMARSVVLTGTARVACDILQERMTMDAGAEFTGLVERPDRRLPKPSRMNGTNREHAEHEVVLIERVAWSRRADQRWVALEA